MIISHEHYISFLLFFVPVTDGEDNVVFTEEVDMSRPCLDTIMNPLWCAAKEKESRGERRGERRKEERRGGGGREQGREEERGEKGGGREGEEVKEKAGRRKKLMVTLGLVLQCALTTSHLSSWLSRELSLRRVWKKELKM